MKMLRKLAAPLVGGLLIATLTLASSGVVFATPAAPQAPAPTECTDCQAAYDDLNGAYTELDLVVADIAAMDIEGLLDQTVTANYADDPLLMVDHLTSEVATGHLLTGANCEDPAMSFEYYSSFVFDGTTYCQEVGMWYGTTTPDGFDFLSHMIFMTEGTDVAVSMGWQNVWDNMIELLTDHDTGGEPNVEDLLISIDSFFDVLVECEDLNCPAEVVCPDCDAKAGAVLTAMDELDALEADAAALDLELTDLETQMNDLQNQLDNWDQLRADFEQMVADAGGMTGADCDGFQVESGQTWGIAHTFGDVQYCLTNEDQLEDLIDNLGTYWETHSSQHLPSEADLNAELDTLFDDWIAKWDEYTAALALIDAKNAEISDLLGELTDCLVTLADLQAQGYCLDEDTAGMQDTADDAQDDLDDGWQAAAPVVVEPPVEPPVADFADTAGHWAEDFINELFRAGVVSGDSGSDDFRPNDNINRAEASKVVTLANGDEPTPCDELFDAFSDVGIDDWFCPYVNTAYTNEYFAGYPDGTFGPGNPILRAEAAAVVLRALAFDIPEYTTYTFPDVTGDEWFADYAEKAYQCGIFEGRDVDGEQLFEGGDNITRAEFSKVVNVSVFNALTPQDCADYECPDCDAILAEAEALGLEVDALGEIVDGYLADVLELEALQTAFSQMVADAGGMTGADCDGFEVQSGQAWGIAHAFGGVEFCLTSESQITDLSTAMGEYWDNNSSTHLPAEETLRAELDTAMTDYNAKMDEYFTKLAEYDTCLDELEALQAADMCL